MAGTIVVDRIESDASYASTINVAGQITFSNTVNFGVFAGTAPVAGFYLPTTNNLAFTTASTERMRITSAGDVGIGTSSPTNFGTGITGLTINGTNGGGFVFKTAGSDTAYLYQTASGFQIQNLQATPITLWTSNTERMRIDSSGNVGIGTTSITEKLTVAGNITATGNIAAGNGMHVNTNTVSVSYSIASGSNAMSAGPITVNTSITVTVPSGSVWTVV
jgi:hypothetical protein